MMTASESSSDDEIDPKVLKQLMKYHELLTKSKAKKIAKKSKSVKSMRTVAAEEYTASYARINGDLKKKKRKGKASSGQTAIPRPKDKEAEKKPKHNSNKDESGTRDTTQQSRLTRV